jgi:hypothetical protein
MAVTAATRIFVSCHLYAPLRKYAARRCAACFRYFFILANPVPPLQGHISCQPAHARLVETGSYRHLSSHERG